jgi:hypothetical protein
VWEAVQGLGQLEVVANPGIPGAIVGSGDQPHLTLSDPPTVRFAGGTPGSVVRGWRSLPLPEPNENGWDFHLRHPSLPDGTHHFARLPVPPQLRGEADHDSWAVQGTSPACLASLDVLGRLAIHVEALPDAVAKTFQQLQDEPGRVLTVEMESATSRYLPQDDPFSGHH